MPKFDKKLQEELIRRLLAEPKALPTSSLKRFGRTAITALRSGRVLLGKNARKPGALLAEYDPEAIARIVSSIGELKGIAMKVGQIMSYIDIALPDEMRDALAVLQTHAQPMDIERVRAIIRAELGERGGPILESLEPTPLAAASIGQVHGARLPDGTRVAVKVQYPEIARAIENDFRPAAVGTALGSLFFPGARIDALVREARERFLEECDYGHEARCQQRFAELYEGHPVITIPAVHAGFCSGRVLTTTFLEGMRFEDFLAGDPPGELRDRIGEVLFEFYLGSLFRYGLYNCDPHPGNYLFLPGGRIGLLDFGCCREFEPDFVTKLADLTRAVHRDDRDALHRAFLGLDMIREGKVYDFDTARRLVRSFYGSTLRDEVQAIDLGEMLNLRQVYDGKLEILKLTLPGEFLFLLRIRFGLMSVLARLGSHANWYRLEQRYIEGLPINRIHSE